MINKILSYLPGDHPWQKRISWFDSIDSTNTYLKSIADTGAPEGTVILAGTQNAGRGRLGRSFESPAGQGIYLSVLLRPNCKPEKLMHLTCAAAVAACEAIAQAVSIRPQIKWTNDLVHHGKKLGGILTELSVDSKNGLVSYAIVGIGINCAQLSQDFPASIADIATSLTQMTQTSVDQALVSAKLIEQLWLLAGCLENRAAIMDAYRKDCMTVGKQVVLLRGDAKTYGTALSVDDDGRLVVAFSDGTVEAVGSGEISVRGMYGYT